MLNKAILIGFILLALLAVLTLLGNRDSGNTTVLASGGGGVYNAQVLGSSSTGGNSFSQGQSLPGLSQRDRFQYADDAEYKTWSPSACSATSIAAILSSMGKPTRTTDVLAIMRERNAITASSGLHDYSVFGEVANRYGLRAVLDESRDLDSHFNSILDYLKRGIPVLVNIQDSQFFPNGHFIAAFRLSSDNTVSVVNPDPVPGRPVIQDWPLDPFKTYFSRTLRSAVFLQK